VSRKKEKTYLNMFETRTEEFHYEDMKIVPVRKKNRRHIDATKLFDGKKEI
jgi:hypothetical protein